MIPLMKPETLRGKNRPRLQFCKYLLVCSCRVRDREVHPYLFECTQCLLCGTNPPCLVARHSRENHRAGKTQDRSNQQHATQLPSTGSRRADRITPAQASLQRAVESWIFLLQPSMEGPKLLTPIWEREYRKRDFLSRIQFS